MIIFFFFLFRLFFFWIWTTFSHESLHPTHSTLWIHIGKAFLVFILLYFLNGLPIINKHNDTIANYSKNMQKPLYSYI